MPKKFSSQLKSRVVCVYSEQNVKDYVFSGLVNKTKLIAHFFVAFATAFA